MKIIQLTRGHSALIDDEDFEKISSVKWCSDGGSPCYAVRVKSINGKPKMIYMHHEVLPRKKGFDVDHINGNGLDNRLQNLRYATHSQNVFSTGMYSNNTSGTKGVYWEEKSGLWYSRITHDGTVHSLGWFKVKEDAITARKKAEKEKFGVFVR